MLEKQYTIEDVIDKLNQCVSLAEQNRFLSFQDKLKKIDDMSGLPVLADLEDEFKEKGISQCIYTNEIIRGAAKTEPSPEDILSYLNTLYRVQRKIINNRKKDPFIEALETECFQPLEKLKRQQLEKRNRDQVKNKSYRITSAKIAPIDRMLLGMNQVVESYQTKWILPPDNVIKTNCKQEIADSIQNCLKTKTGEDTADYQALKRCANKVLAYLMRGITCFTGAIFIVGFFSSFKKLGFRTDSHATAHQVLKNIRKLSF